MLLSLTTADFNTIYLLAIPVLILASIGLGGGFTLCLGTRRRLGLILVWSCGAVLVCVSAAVAMLALHR